MTTIPRDNEWGNEKVKDKFLKKRMFGGWG